MWRRSLRAIWLLALFSLTSAALGQTPLRYEELRNDPRLQRTIDLDMTGAPLSELLASLSDKKLNLSCADRCRELKVQVRLTKQPLHLVMKGLADLIPGYWQRAKTDDGYLFDMTPEAAARQDRWWRLYLAERQRALNALRRNLLQRMREGPPVRVDIKGAEDIPEERVREGITLGPALFQALPPALQERIADHMVDTAFSRASGSTWLGNSYLREGVVSISVDALPSGAKAALEHAAPEMIRPGARVRFHNLGREVMVSLSGTDGKWRGMPFSLTPGFVPETFMLGLNHKMLPAIVRRMGKQAPDAWKRLAGYQNSVVWQNAPVELESVSVLNNRPPRRADVLDWLAERAGVQFLADYHSTWSRPMDGGEKTKKLTRPLVEELNDRAAQLDMSWKRTTEDLYLFRNNRWYRDDRLEAPAALLQRWEKEFRDIRESKESAAVSEGYLVSPRERRVLDLKADMVARINLLQIANGLANYVPAEVGRVYDPNKPKADWLPFQILSETMLCDYYTLRFYAALSVSQRDRLLKGQLSFSSLNSSLKRMAAFILPELDEQDQKFLSRLRLGLSVGRPWVFITRSESYSTDQATELQLMISQASDDGDK